MDEREKNLAKAAGQAFLRYGVKRTTMNDIAEEAGVSRQTLYNAFANKNDVVRALIRDFHDEALAAIQADCAAAAGLDAKLDAVFQHLIVAPYDFLHSSPHAQDIVDGINDAARDEITAREPDYLAVIDEILAAHLKGPASGSTARDLTARDLAEVVWYAAKGAKAHVQSRTDLLRALANLKRLILAEAAR